MGLRQGEKGRAVARLSRRARLCLAGLQTVGALLDGRATAPHQRSISVFTTPAFSIPV